MTVTTTIILILCALGAGYCIGFVRGGQSRKRAEKFVTSGFKRK